MPSSKELALTHAYITSILDYNPATGLMFWKVTNSNRAVAGSIAGQVNGSYIKIRINKSLFMLHRLAWFYTHRTWPVDKLDHENGRTFDNRIVNLRECTYSQNNQNAANRKDNTSGTKGVCFDKRRGTWYYRIYTNGVKTGKYGFITKKDAIDARKAAEQIYHGNFARK